MTDDTRKRADAVDVLRGLVIVIMVLDHAREYARGPGVADPMVLEGISPLLFWMRWVTHFCAPVFTLLAGMSVGLQARFGAPMPAWQWTTITRGLVLIALEFTVIQFAWTFSFVWPLRYAQVIWGIGVSLIVLGLLQRVPVQARVVVGLLCVAGHNALDAWHPTAPPWLHWSWAILHDRQVMPLWGDAAVRTSYPVLPMIGLVLLGEALGRWYRTVAPAQRAVWLMRGGAAMIALFVVLRTTNVYGDLHVAMYGASLAGNVMAALNTTKYPMSLSFVLMTVGPALLLLALWDRGTPAWTAPLRTLGQVPMFLYLAHLYFLHAAGLLLALAAGYPWSAFDFRTTITGIPAEFSYPLWLTFPLVAVTLVVLYRPAQWYARVRASKRYPITRFL